MFYFLKASVFKYNNIDIYCKFIGKKVLKVMQVLISSAKYDSTKNPKLTCYFQKTFSKYGVILNVFPVNKSVIGHYLYQT